jgi:predicted neutral ceramidase superfamily lipid hydrolase
MCPSPRTQVSASQNSISPILTVLKFCRYDAFLFWAHNLLFGPFRSSCLSRLLLWVCFSSSWVFSCIYSVKSWLEIFICKIFQSMLVGSFPYGQYTFLASFSLTIPHFIFRVLVRLSNIPNILSSCVTSSLKVKMELIIVYQYNLQWDLICGRSLN